MGAGDFILHLNPKLQAAGDSVAGYSAHSLPCSESTAVVSFRMNTGTACM